MSDDLEILARTVATVTDRLDALERAVYGVGGSRPRRRSRSAPTIPAPPNEAPRGRPPKTDAELLREAVSLLRRVRRRWGVSAAIADTLERMAGELE